MALTVLETGDLYLAGQQAVKLYLAYLLAFMPSFIVSMFYYAGFWASAVVLVVLLIVSILIYRTMNTVPGAVKVDPRVLNGSHDSL